MKEMVELPIKKFSENKSANRFSCMLKSDDSLDEKVLKKIAKEQSCIKIIQYKDCFEHVMKFTFMFNNPEKKKAFLTAIINCSGLEIVDKLTKRYA